MPALRAGVEISKRISSDFVLGIQASYQRTFPTRYATSLPDERFRRKAGDSFRLGLDLTYDDQPSTEEGPPNPSYPGTFTVGNDEDKPVDDGGTKENIPTKPKEAAHACWSCVEGLKLFMESTSPFQSLDELVKVQDEEDSGSSHFEVKKGASQPGDKFYVTITYSTVVAETQGEGRATAAGLPRSARRAANDCAESDPRRRRSQCRW